MESEEKMECNICLFDGCDLPTEEGKRFCSKLHYHASRHKQQKANLANNPRVICCMTFACEIAPVAAFGFKVVMVLSFDKVL